MGVTAATAARLGKATSYAYRGTDALGHKVFEPLYADDVPEPAPARSSAPYGCHKIAITDVQHPWVQMAWCDDLPLPQGFIPGGALDTLYRARPSLVTQENTVIPYVAPDAEVQALIRQASREAADAALADLREQRKKQHDDYLKETFSYKYVPGAVGPKPPRAPRTPRPPRPARPPRPPRTPRPPRVPGTKNTDPKKKPCKHKNSLGQCVDKGCIASATIPEPNVGHSSCNWGPVDSCGNCVQQGCTGAASFLLKPLLKLLPKYWSQESVQKVQDMRKENQQAQRAAKQFAALPKISPPAYRSGQPTPPPSGGPSGPCCVCNDWPGWVICAGCSHSVKCICHTPCIPIPPGQGYGY